MKAILLIITVIVSATLIFGEIEFSTNPFKLTISSWRTVVAVLLFFIGGFLIYRDGVINGKKDIIKQIENYINNK